MKQIATRFAILAAYSRDTCCGCHSSDQRRVTTGTCRHRSGENAEREELAKALDYLRAGDTLAVPSLDRLGCSIHDLITIVAGLLRRGIGFTSLHEALDTTTPG